MIEIDEIEFESEVIQASHRTPVLVDFWAPWCGPCRVLGPVLEHLEQSFAGRFRLVKIDSDANSGIAARYGVRGIPNVIAFLDGEPVERFVGALPESQVRAFIERVIPDASEQQRRKARALVGEGRTDEALAALRAAIELNPASEDAHIDLAELLLEHMPSPLSTEQLAEAGQALSVVGRAGRREARWQALELRLSSLRDSATLAPEGQLLARVAAEPGDLGARRALAEMHVARREFPQALDQLLEIVNRGRGEERETARVQILSVLQLLAAEPELVSGYRRRLALLLNR